MTTTKQARMLKVYRDRLFFQDDCDRIIAHLKTLNASAIKITILGNDKAITFNATDKAINQILEWSTANVWALSNSGKIEYRYQGADQVISEFIKG
jgi:hypothetical protein